MRYIGDVHGKFGKYKRIIKDAPASIQIGDLGVGFRDYRDDKWMANPPYALMVKRVAKFIRGNHDNPAVCRNHSQWIPDGHYDPESKTMFVGGADSIDKQFRIKDYSWWDDEELSYGELKALLEKQRELKPEIMVTHEAPPAIGMALVAKVAPNHRFNPSRTSLAFEQMAPPKIWIFGHYHLHFDEVVNGTRFICLGELEYIDL